jgi:hypothetical protein
MRARSTYLPVRFRRPQRGYEASGMAIRLFPLAVIVILALAASACGSRRLTWSMRVPLARSTLSPPESRS